MRRFWVEESEGNVNEESIFTRTLGSVRLVHIAISSRTLISGYRLRAKRASNSCNCWLVKWVLWRRCLLLFLSFLFFDSSNWLSGLSGLWLGSSWTPGSETKMTIKKKLRWGGTRIWTKGLSDCSRLLYHWAIPPDLWNEVHLTHLFFQHVKMLCHQGRIHIFSRTYCRICYFFHL